MSEVRDFIDNAYMFRRKLYGELYQDVELYAKVSYDYFSKLRASQFQGVCFFEYWDRNDLQKEGISAIIYGIKVIETSQKNDLEFLFKIKGY